MHYSIEGRNCELLRVDLNDTEGVLAEVGTLIFMRGEVTWKVVLPGRGFAAKVAAGIKRKIGGASVVLTEYAGPGEVGFSGGEPGTIRAVELVAGEDDAALAAYLRTCEVYQVLRLEHTLTPDLHY